MTCLVFKTTCIDRRNPLRECAFPFASTMLFPPLDKRNTCDRARGLCITSERYIGGLGARCLSRTNGSRQPVLLAFASSKVLIPQCLARVIFLPASGTSPVRHPLLPDLHEWSSSQLWCGEYPAIPLGKRSQVAYMYIGKGDEFAQGVWWINNLLYLCTRN